MALKETLKQKIEEHRPRTTEDAAAVKEAVASEEVESLTLKGLLKPVPTFNVLGLKSASS